MSIHFHIAATEAWILVPESVVGQHLTAATELELKVLLLLLRQGKQASDTSVCETLGITPKHLQDVVAAWISRGVLSMEDKWVVVAQPPMRMTSARDHSKAQTLHRPEYDMRQVADALNENQELRDVLRAAPSLLGREVGATEFTLLYSLTDYYGLTPQAVEHLFMHCRTLGRTSGRQLESMASDWSKRGISTGADAEKELYDYRKKLEGESVVRRAFGLGDRKLTHRERSYIEQWTQVWQFDESLLELAYERGCDRTSRPPFAYFNRILESWNENGIRTVAQAEKEDLPPKRGSRKKVADTAQPASYNLREFDEWSFQSIYGASADPEDGSAQDEQLPTA